MSLDSSKDIPGPDPERLSYLAQCLTPSNVLIFGYSPEFSR